MQTLTEPIESRMDYRLSLASADFAALLAICLRYPTRELAEGIKTCELQQDFAQCCDDMAIPHPCTFDQATLPNTPLEELVSLLGKDYTQLFIAPIGSITSPYECMFRNSRKRIPDEILPFVNNCTMHVEQTMRNAGVAVNRGKGEPEDHVSVELEFLRHLYLSIARCIRSENDSECARYRAILSDFQAKHLRGWLPDFFDEMGVRAKTSFYQNIAALGKAFILYGPQ